MGSKPSGGGTQTTKTEPWDAQKPYLIESMKAAQDLYHNGDLAPKYFEGDTVAAQSQWTQDATQMQADRALNGSGIINAAEGNIQGLMGNQGAGMTALNQYAGMDFNQGNTALQQLQAMNGNAINAGNDGLQQLNQLAANDNPYMDALYQRANDKAQASLDSNFNRAGRYGSGAHEAAAADAANNLANEMYSSLYDKRINAANAASSAYNQGIGQGINAQQAAGQMYSQGQQLGVNAAQDAASAYNAWLAQQNDMAGTAQQLGNQAYTDAAMLSEAGGVQDDYAQQLINADIDRWNYNQQLPLTEISNYNQLIQGSYGGTSTATGQQSGGSKLGGMLGGALSGASAGAAIGGPWGAAIGGIGGGLLGMF